jgi:hypothetical protein
VTQTNQPPAKPGRFNPDQCIHCGEHMAKTEALPFLTGDGGHVWLHDGCHGEWTTQRRGEAVTALAQLGLTPRYKAEG